MTTLTLQTRAPKRVSRRKGTTSPVATAFAYMAGVVIVVITLVPLLFVLLGGFRTTAQINESPTGLPNPIVWDNYRIIITSGDFWTFLFNSAKIAVVASVLNVVVGSMAAFALSRYIFKGRDALYTFFTLGLLFPVSVAALPLYLWLRDLGLLENMFGVAIPEAAFGLSITIVILRPFMRAIPIELEDAAAIDGCSRLGFFWRVLIPLSKPALMTVAILAVVLSWNMFLLPLLVLNDPNEWTLPLGVANYQSQYASDTARVFAFTFLSIVPTLIFFVLAERKIVGGLTGAVKG